MKPVIGITNTPSDRTFDHGAFRQSVLSDTYTRAVEAAGGIPVILPAHVKDVGSLLDALDGVISSGGGDINPAYWNEELHPTLDRLDDERDHFEIELVRAARDRDMPLLGICRGIQVMNVALGGDLYQDIPDQLPEAMQHSQHRDGLMNTDTSHSVTVSADGNLLHKIVAKDSLVTNSFHHQALRTVPDSMTVVATTEDGVIEGVVVPKMTFGLGVQWHPEMLADKHEDHAKIFDALVQAAETYQAKRKK